MNKRQNIDKRQDEDKEKKHNQFQRPPPNSESLTEHNTY